MQVLFYWKKCPSTEWMLQLGLSDKNNAMMYGVPQVAREEGIQGISQLFIIFPTQSTVFMHHQLL